MFAERCASRDSVPTRVTNCEYASSIVAPETIAAERRSAIASACPESPGAPVAEAAIVAGEAAMPAATVIVAAVVTLAVWFLAR